MSAKNTVSMILNMIRYEGGRKYAKLLCFLRTDWNVF